jgi:hypothetical protein
MIHLLFENEKDQILKKICQEYGMVSHIIKNKVYFWTKKVKFNEAMHKDRIMAAE